MHIDILYIIIYHIIMSYIRDHASTAPFDGFARVRLGSHKQLQIGSSIPCGE